MDSTMTPPSVSRSRSSSLGSEFDEEYFLKTYVPLSNLPTPPLSSHSTSHAKSAEENLALGENLDPDLLGPSTHLTNLIPASASLTASCVPLVHAILTRADLPIETVALAVCILDSLNSRFALAWRQGLPLCASYDQQFYEEEREERQHIDSVHPEIIVLAALALAVKFLDDKQLSAKRCAAVWGKDLWTLEQVNFTQRVVLENLGYRILPLWNEDIIGEALEDMRRAGRVENLDVHVAENWEVETCCGSFENGEIQHTHRRTISTGKAVTGMEQLITPQETPMVENSRGTKDISCETRDAFSRSRSQKKFRMQGRVSDVSSASMADTVCNDGEDEPFPVFEDPMVMGMEYVLR